jgi:hypothetical protein
VKSNFKVTVPEIKIEGRSAFPGLVIDANLEYSADEFLALLPHVVELRKVIGEQLAEARTELLTFVRDASAAVGPDLMAMAKQILDHNLKTPNNSERRDAERHELEMANLREMHMLDLEIKSRILEPALSETPRNGNNGSIFSRR